MRKLIPAVFALLAAGACHALGFGEMALHSALNQPLDATIELVAVKPSERESVDVRIPDAEMFERFGIARNPVLDDVRVEVAGRQGDRLRVTLSTRRPVREPFLTLLLEADWDGGRALREYTVLLDPPTEAPTTPAPPARAERDTTAPDTAAAAPPETRTAAEEPAAAEQAPQASPETAPARAQAPEQRAPRAPAAEPEYRRYGPVAPDETLWSIAYELRPDPQISMDQMLLAIYQANPQAFDDNINLLNAGSTLIIPSADEIRAIDETAARQEIADQKRDYARSQGATRTAAAQQPEATPQAEPVGEAPPEDGELRLEPPTDDESGTAAAEAAPAETEEPAAGEQIAENAAATARALAEAAERAGQAEPAPSGEQAPEDGEGDAEASGTVTTEEDAAAAEGGPGAGTPAPEDQPGGTEGEAGEATTADAETAGAPEETAPATDEPATEPAAAQEPAAEEPAGETVPVGAESVIPEGTAGLLTSRNLLLALATLLLVVTIVMWLRRRQYKPVPADFSSQVASGVERDIVPAMDETAPGTTDHRAASAESVEEVLADADSYIEHELYDEALAALKVGMEQYPGDPALRRKALEVHYAAGARDAFLAAVEAYSPRPAADDPEWLAIAAMGRELAPDDPMFAESAPRERTQPDTADASDTFDLERSFDSYFDDEEEAPAGPPAAEDAGRESAPDLSWPEEQDEARPETGRATEPETAGFESSEFESTGSDEAAIDEVTSGTAAGESTGGAGDDLDLDFDWSTDTDEQPAAGEDFPETAETGGARDEDTKADAGPPTLDIDLSEFDVGPEEERREAGPEETGQTAAADSGEDEFADFDFDSLSLDEDRPAERSGDEAPAEPADEPAEPERPEEGTVEKPEFEASEGLSLDQAPVTEEDGSEAEGAETTPSLEVDLGESEAAPADAEESPAESGAASEGDDEVTTKLDLARAYLDMGEPDMARSLLEEVKDQGNAEQRREAEELLERAG